MTPKIGEMSTGVAKHRLMINDVPIGPDVTKTELFLVVGWLKSSWPDLVVAVLASAHVEEEKKPSGMQQRAAPATARQINAQMKYVARILAAAEEMRKMRQ